MLLIRLVGAAILAITGVALAAYCGWIAFVAWVWGGVIDAHHLADLDIGSVAEVGAMMLVAIGLIGVGWRLAMTRPRINPLKSLRT